MDEIMQEMQRLGIAEKEAEELCLLDDYGMERFSQLLKTIDCDIDKLVNLAYNLDEINSYLCLPIYDELFRRKYFLEEHVGDIYKRYGLSKEAGIWYKRGMESSGYPEAYVENALGYIDCLKMSGEYEKIAEVILNLLPYCNNDSVNCAIWERFARIYKGEYGIEPCPDIAIGCLMEAKRCYIKQKQEIPDIDREISFMRKTNPHLYETAKNLNILEAIRKNLAGTGQKTNSNVQEVADSRLTLRVGERVDITRCQAQIAALGYVQSSMVFQQGQMVRRGGIIDVFPFGSKDPYRIDWLDDCIDSIRTYDSKSMLSKERCDAVVIAVKQEPPQKQNEDKKPKVRVSRRRQQPKQHEDRSKFTERHYQIIINVLVAIVLLLCYLLYAKG